MISLTRVSLLAELLYDMGIGLKRFDPSKLARKKYRGECIRNLSAMQYLVHCLGMKHIADEDARKILALLDTHRHSRLQNYADGFLEAEAESDYSDEYHSFLFEMASSLTYCISVLSSKRKGEYDTVCKVMRAFHNAPRAFFSLSNGMKISLQDAKQWGIVPTVWAGE